MSKFKRSYKGIGEMLCSLEMQAEMKRRAELVAVQAEATAPVDTGTYDESGKLIRKPRHPGRYKRSFTVESGVRGKTGSRRAYGRVVNDSPEARWVEYGAKDTPRYRTLGKALDAAGD